MWDTRVNLDLVLNAIRFEILNAVIENLLREKLVVLNAKQ